MAQRAFDIVIVGASFGGVSAALAAARYGKRVALIDAGGHVGGQATSQGVTRWDEGGHVIAPSRYGSTRSYRLLKDAIRRWYAANSRLAAGVDPQTFNPGFSESGHCFSVDPHVTEAVLLALLADARDNITLLLDTAITGATMDHRTIEAFRLADGDAVTAAIYVDCTDLGELLPYCGAAWTIGAEAKSDTEEPHAEQIAQPGFIQPITVPLAVERRPDGEDHRIGPPPGYDQLIRSQGYRVYNERNGMIGGVFTSAHSEHPEWETIFNYRQYIDHRNFDDPNYAYDRSTLNVGCNDYQAEVIPTDSATQDAAIRESARSASIGFLHWLQTAAPHDAGGGSGYPNLAVRADAFGRPDGTAPDAYVRESRRIRKPFVRVLEQHIAVADPRTTLARAPTNFSDSCGIVDYSIDVHRVYGPPATPWQGLTTRPFQIPLGALIPSDVDNLITGCKNLGATHLTGAAYRVHPGEWAVGEAAGTFAAYCVGQGVAAADAYRNPARVAAFQLRLLELGAPIFWWDDLTFDSDAATFAAANLLGVRGFLSDPTDLRFRPNDQMSQSERDVVNSHAGKTLPWPARAMPRANAALWLCAELGLPSSEIVRHWQG